MESTDTNAFLIPPLISQNSVETPVGVRKFQYKSNLQSIVKQIRKLKLKPAHLKRLQESNPFWKLIEAITNEKLIFSNCRKSDKKLLSIVKRYNKETQSFEIAKQSIKIEKSDMEAIFGIKSGNVPVEHERVSNDSSDPFISEWFGKADKMTTKLLATALEKAVNKNKTDDIVRLMALYILCSLFLTTSCANLGWGYIRNVKDLKKMNSYDWAGHVLDTLLISLGKHAAEKVRGCIIVIPYVLLERFSICTPLCTTKEVLCTKWNLNVFFKEMEKKGNVDSVCEAQAVSQNHDNTTSGKKMRNAVDTSNISVALSPEAMNSATQVYLARRAKNKVAVKENTAICNPYGRPRQEESGMANELIFIDKSPIPSIDSSTRRVDKDVQGTFDIPNAQVDPMQLSIPGKNDEINLCSSTKRIVPELHTGFPLDKKETALRATKRSMFVPQNILQENSEEYELKANTSDATEIAPIVPYSDGCLGDNKSGRANGLNVVHKSPSKLKVDSSIGGRSELEKQQTRNEQFKRVPVVEAHTIIEIDDESDSETEKVVENEIAHERDPKRLRLSPQNIVHEKVEPQFVFDFKDFKIEVDGKTIDFPQQVREDYFKLCCCRKSYLHRHLTKGINRELAASIISETVKITNEIRDSKISSEEKVANWLTALRGFKVFGMDIGFIRERVNQLSGLVMNSKIFKEVKIEPDKIERDRIQKEIIELGKKKRKLDDEIKGKEKVDANYEVTYEEAASAPW